MNFLRKIRLLFRKAKLETDMAEEMQLHVELQTERNVASGMNPNDARYAALRQFGNVAVIQEQAREVRNWIWLEQAGQDLRQAVRALARNRGFTLVAVSTLALGLGVNTALFSVFNAAALRSLPLKSPEQLVDVMGRNAIGWRISGFSYPDYLDLREARQGFAGLAVWSEMTAAMDSAQVRAPAFVQSRSNSGDISRLPVQFVTENYFALLGADLLFGRGFLPEENARPGSHPVIVLQHQFWQQQFGADPEILGKTIRLNDTAFTVIGVTAPEFVGKTPAPPLGWVPAMMFDTMIGKGPSLLADRYNARFRLFARLLPEIPREQARIELEVIARSLGENYPDKDRKVVGIEFQDSATFMSFPLNWRTLIILSPVWLGFALVLLVASANVANLMLVRASTRQQEIGVRLALGATRGRILRHLLAESLLVSLAGGIAGLFVTTWLLHVLRPPLLALLPQVNRSVRDWMFLNLSPDYRVFAFTLILTLITAILAGLFPALQAARAGVNASLKSDGFAFSRPSRLRHSLVVIQIAVCLTLLAASGLLVSHVLRFSKIDTGLDTTGVYRANLSSLPANFSQVNGAAQGQAFEAAQAPAARRQTLEVARGLPGIDAVAQAYVVPFLDQFRLTPVVPERTSGEDSPLLARFNFVSAEYFAALRLPVKRGRLFTVAEVETRAPVLVLSEATAERFWPGQDPVGKHLRVSAVAFAGGWTDPKQARPGSSDTFSSFEVVGVTPNTRSSWVWEQDETMLYLPLPPEVGTGANPLTLRTLVRLAGPRETAVPLASGAAITRGVQFNLGIQQSLEEQRKVQMLPFKGIAVVATILGSLALLMAAVGLYGVMAFAVSQRVREIGIRVALGATTDKIVGLFVRQGMRLVAVGLALGSIGALLAATTLSKLIVGARAFEPVMLGCVALLLGGAALLACWLPARRAAKVDPMVALRTE